MTLFFLQQQLLAHIGFCTVNGFWIKIPYLVKDLSDMIYDLDPPELPENNMLPASINMDFNGEEDAEILAQTREYCYWWTFKLSDKNIPWVTPAVVFDHFREYFQIVSRVDNSMKVTDVHTDNENYATNNARLWPD